MLSKHGGVLQWSVKDHVHVAGVAALPPVVMGSASLAQVGLPNMSSSEAPLGLSIVALSR